MTKVPCTKCGALIIESTSERNGGLCVPCKSGRRDAIETGKRREQEQRDREKNDPFRRLWRELVHRVHQTELGFDGLSETEKRYFAVGLLDGEVYNGGFDQFFFNSSGSYYSYAVLGLKEMDAVQSLQLLERAKQVIFNFSEVLTDTKQRREYLIQTESSSRSERLEALDALYWKDPDSLSSRCEAFARKHSLV